MVLSYLWLIFIQKIEWNEETATVSKKYKLHIRYYCYINSLPDCQKVQIFH